MRERYRESEREKDRERERKRDIDRERDRERYTYMIPTLMSTGPEHISVSITTNSTTIV